MTDSKSNIDEQLEREIQNTRIIIAIGIGSALSIGIIVALLLALNSKDNQIKELSNNRVMYGILSSDGRYFESTKDIPARIVKNFITSFSIDWANFIPDTVKENRKEASKKFSIAYRKEIERKNRYETTKIVTSRFSQQFVPSSYSVKQDENNRKALKVAITGTRKQWQNGNVMGDGKGEEVKYSFTIIKSPPTASSPEGLEIDSMQEPAQQYVK